MPKTGQETRLRGIREQNEAGSKFRILLGVDVPRIVVEDLQTSWDIVTYMFGSTTTWNGETLSYKDLMALLIDLMLKLKQEFETTGQALAALIYRIGSFHYLNSDECIVEEPPSRMDPGHVLMAVRTMWAFSVVFQVSIFDALHDLRIAYPEFEESFEIETAMDMGPACPACGAPPVAYLTYDDCEHRACLLCLLQQLSDEHETLSRFDCPVGTEEVDLRARAYFYAVLRLFKEKSSAYHTVQEVRRRDRDEGIPSIFMDPLELHPSIDRLLPRALRCFALRVRHWQNNVDLQTLLKIDDLASTVGVLQEANTWVDAKDGMGKRRYVLEDFLVSVIRAIANAEDREYMFQKLILDGLFNPRDDIPSCVVNGVDINPVDEAGRAGKGVKVKIVFSADIFPIVQV